MALFSPRGAVVRRFLSLIAEKQETSNSPLTMTEIREAVVPTFGNDQNFINQMLKLLDESGDVWKHGNGRWSVLQTTPDVPDSNVPMGADE